MKLHSSQAQRCQPHLGRLWGESAKRVGLPAGGGGTAGSQGSLNLCHFGSLHHPPSASYLTPKGQY